MSNGFLQKLMIVAFCGMCAAGMVQFYRHMILHVNDDISKKTKAKAADVRDAGGVTTASEVSRTIAR